MKFSEPTKATLYRLRRIAGDLLLIAPDQFALIGKNEQVALTIGKKRRQHAGLTVRGTLLNTVKKDVGLHYFTHIADLIRPGAEVFLSGEEVVMPPNSCPISDELELEPLRAALVALDDKLSAKPVCTFGISRSQSSKSRRAITVLIGDAPRAEVAVRLCKEARRRPQCELSLIPDRHEKPPELTHTFSWQLDHFEGDAFAFSTRDELYKQLPPSDYQVTIYSSGVAEFMAMDRRLTFFIEEQKLADKAIKRQS